VFFFSLLSSFASQHKRGQNESETCMTNVGENRDRKFLLMAMKEDGENKQENKAKRPAIHLLPKHYALHDGR